MIEVDIWLSLLMDLSRFLVAQNFLLQVEIGDSSSPPINNLEKFFTGNKRECLDDPLTGGLIAFEEES